MSINYNDPRQLDAYNQGALDAVQGNEFQPDMFFSGIATVVNGLPTAQEMADYYSWEEAYCQGYSNNSDFSNTAWQLTGQSNMTKHPVTQGGQEQEEEESEEEESEEEEGGEEGEEEGSEPNPEGVESSGEGYTVFSTATASFATPYGGGVLGGEESEEGGGPGGVVLSGPYHGGVLGGEEAEEGGGPGGVVLSGPYHGGVLGGEEAEGGGGALIRRPTIVIATIVSVQGDGAFDGRPSEVTISAQLITMIPNRRSYSGPDETGFASAMP